jgi:hypothetical protein
VLLEERQALKSIQKASIMYLFILKHKTLGDCTCLYLCCQ